MLGVGRRSQPRLGLGFIIVGIPTLLAFRFVKQNILPRNAGAMIGTRLRGLAWAHRNPFLRRRLQPSCRRSRVKSAYFCGEDRVYSDGQGDPHA